MELMKDYVEKPYRASPLRPEFVRLLKRSMMITKALADSTFKEELRKVV